MQLELLKKIVHLIPPFKAAKDAGLSVRRERDDGAGARFYVEHPKNALERLYLTEFEFVEAGKGTGFFGGSVFDFLALIEGSLDSAIEVFFERYREKIHNISAYEEACVKDMLKTSSKRNRRGFEFLATLTKNYQNSAAFHDILAWQRGRGSDPKFLNHWSYPCSSEQIMRFMSQLYDGDDSLFPFDPEPNKNYLVIPYYSTWSNMSHIAVEDPKNRRSYKIPLNTARVAWAGLHGSPHFRPGRMALFFDNPHTASVMQAYYRDRLDDSLCLSTSIQSDFEDANTIKFRRGMTLATPSTSFGICSRLSSICDEFFVQRFHDYKAQGSPLTWVEYLADELLNITNEDGEGSPRIRALVSAADMSPETRSNVSQTLQEAEAPMPLVDTLNDWSTGATFKLRYCTVEETSHGYLLSKPGSSEQFLLTNFVFTIDHSVVIGTTNRVMLVGNIRMGDLMFPYEMDRKSSVSYKGIEEAALKGFNKWRRYGGQDMAEQRVPVVTAPDQAKALAGVIGQKIAAAPYQEGYDCLGWLSPEVFVAPYWSRNELTLTEGKTPVVLDGFVHEGCYRFSPFPNQNISMLPDLDFIQGDLRYLITTLVGWLVRGALDYPVTPEIIEDTTKARNTLKAICSVFGQVAPLVLNPSVRKSSTAKLLPGMSKLPAYAYTNDVEALTKLDYPLWILSESGLHTGPGLSKDQLNNLTGIIYRVINKTVDWINAGGNSEVVSYRTPVDQRFAEAQRILKSVNETFGDDPTISILLTLSPARKWMEVLKGGHDDRIKKYVSYDLESGMHVLQSRQTKSNPLPYPSLELVEEVKAADFTVELRNGRYFIPSQFIEDQMSLAREDQIIFPIYKVYSRPTQSNNSVDYKEDLG